MPRWVRVLRGMLGTGLIFALGLGGLATLATLVAWLVGGGNASAQMFEMAAKFTVVGFLVGVGFSGLFAVLGRGRSFEKVTLPTTAAIGGGGGLLYFLAIAINARHVWTLGNAVGNFLLLVFLGAGASSATLLIARRARGELKSGGDPDRLGR